MKNFFLGAVSMILLFVIVAATVPSALHINQPAKPKAAAVWDGHEAKAQAWLMKKYSEGYQEHKTIHTGGNWVFIIMHKY